MEPKWPSSRLSLEAEAVGARVRIQTDDFNLGAEVRALHVADLGVGAVTSFVGTVRDRHGTVPAGPTPTVRQMELEHYPGMTEAAIEAMIDEAFGRFDIRAARVIHRVGRLEPGEQIVLVAVASAHRGESFKACEFLMDYLKTQAPFWKKEHTADGARWVDARVSDDQALARWGIAAPNAHGSAQRSAEGRAEGGARRKRGEGADARSGDGSD